MQFLSEIQTTTAVVSWSLAASEDTSYRIKNLYPFPLAFPYRLLDAVVEPPILYKEQLRVAENMLAFLASITLALLEDAVLQSQSNIRQAFQGGVSPGTWLDLATKGATFLTEEKAGPLAIALKSLWRRANESPPSMPP